MFRYAGNTSTESMQQSSAMAAIVHQFDLDLPPSVSVEDSTNSGRRPQALDHGLAGCPADQGCTSDNYRQSIANTLNLGQRGTGCRDVHSVQLLKIQIAVNYGLS